MTATRDAPARADAAARADAPARAVVLVVDRIRCDGYAMCAELLPEMIELDEWGYPIVRTTSLPEALLPHARRAVEVCPVLALRLRDA